MEMTTDITRNAALWSEVINYLKFSSAATQNASLEKTTAAQAPGMDQISVFRTSILQEHDLTKIAVPLDRLIGKGKWTIDMDDEEKVLRAIFPADRQADITTLCKQFGYSCVLMPY